MSHSEAATPIRLLPFSDQVRKDVEEEVGGTIRFGLVGYEPFVKVSPDWAEAIRESGAVKIDKEDSSLEGLMLPFARSFADSLGADIQFIGLSWSQIEISLAGPRPVVDAVLDPVAVGRGGVAIVQYTSIETPYLATARSRKPVLDMVFKYLRERRREDAVNFLDSLEVSWTKGTIEETIAKFVMGLVSREEMGGGDLLENAKEGADAGFAVVDGLTCQKLSDRGDSIIGYPVFPGSKVPAGLAFRRNYRALGNALRKGLLGWMPTAIPKFRTEFVEGMLEDVGIIVDGRGFAAVQKFLKLWEAGEDPEEDFKTPGPRRLGLAEERVRSMSVNVDPDLLFPSDDLLPLLLGLEHEELENPVAKDLGFHLRSTFRMCIVNWYFEASAGDVIHVVAAESERIEQGLIQQLFESAPVNYYAMDGVLLALYGELLAIAKARVVLGKSGLRLEMSNDQVVIRNDEE